jgi:hypothetical protein
MILSAMLPQANKQDVQQASIASVLPPLPPGSTVDALVVGCGPAGITLAAQYALKGLSVGLVGKHCHGMPASHPGGEVVTIPPLKGFHACKSFMCQRFMCALQRQLLPQGCFLWVRKWLMISFRQVGLLVCPAWRSMSA